MRKIILILFVLVPILGISQTIEIPTYTNVIKANGGYFVSGIIIDGDTFPHIKLYKVVIFPERKFTSSRQKKKYDKLTFNVKKVYPYAVIIGDYYRDIERDLAYIPDRKEQKKYVKSKEKELRNEYEETLINLTITQGRLLIKLVDRQTDHTTYEVIEEFKGEMNAFFWQSIAILFGSNLKDDYDTEEDQMIEEIIAKIENGQI
ncbi:MAG: DUF4294 domain-containing protein [Bacteroidales bacterium]|nr:DUF4294 domain-containing protein [Bacteroidales bacterium]